MFIDEKPQRGEAKLDNPSVDIPTAINVEQYFRLLVDAVKDYSIFMLDPHGKVTSWNHGAERMKGYRAAEIIGRHFSCFYPEPDVRAGKPQHELEVAAHEGTYEEEGWRLRKDGSLFWAHVVITAFRDHRGALVGFAKITRDATERMRADQASRDLWVKLMHGQDEERRKISRELHDMTGPALSGVLMNLALVERDSTALGEKARVALREAENQVRNVSSHVRTMSYLLHPPLLTEVGLAAAVQWFLDGFSRRTGIITQLEAPSDVGRLPEYTEISLFRVIQECLTNIHRHANSRTALVRLNVDADDLLVEVIDQGKDQSKDQSKGPPRGFTEGMGIKGMRERVSELGGTFTISPSPSGATARFSVPIAPRVKSRGYASKNKARLLLVDDHEIVRQGLASLLQGVEDFEICGEAASGEDAIREAERTAPDIVIMDLRMPGIDGLQATRSILKTHPATDVLIFTVDESEQVLREALKAGARGCVSKTDAGSTLVSLLRTLASERETRPHAN